MLLKSIANCTTNAPQFNINYRQDCSELLCDDTHYKILALKKKACDFIFKPQGTERTVPKNLKSVALKVEFLRVSGKFNNSSLHVKGWNLKLNKCTTGEYLDQAPIEGQTNNIVP